MPLSAGARIGPFEIVAPIGAGGMGEVYCARDTRLGRLVALKVVHTQFGSRFETEARAISALNHPNVCTLFDVGKLPGGEGYLVMEFVEGETLAARLKSGPLPVEEGMRLAIAIADALGEAHAKGMTHRDLKPSNVMITTEGRTKLLDFGLAKMLTDSDADATRTVDGAVLGTFAYMSPEQLQGKPLGASSDIFSFGALLYEMLSGQRAYTTLLREEPPLVTGISGELAGIVRRCLRHNPEDRFATMAEVRAALERTGQKQAAPSAQSAPSIAVLPFANMSGDKENEYFSDGLAEEILNSLTRVPGLKVTARTSAFAFRGEKLDIRKIGESLGVGTVLEGSVRRAGNRIRVSAQLISSSDGYHLWSERYDREMTDVFAVQDEIAQAIVETLKLKLAPTRAGRPPVKLEAYNLLLKARYYGARNAPGDSARSISCCEQAVALDPNYASAYALLAVRLFAAAQLGLMPVREIVTRVRAEAIKALELDETVPEAHATLATVAASFDFDWTTALRHYRLATADETYGYAPAACVQMVLLPLGRFEEAIESMERVIAADPLSGYPRFILSQALQACGAFERARRELETLLEFHEKDFGPYFGLGSFFTVAGQTSDAIAILEKGMAAVPWFLPIHGLLAANYRRAGEQVKAAAIVGQLASRPLTDIAMGYYHVVCGEYDRAADCFQRALDQRHFAVQLVAYGPLFEEFRKTPRGRDLLAQMNLVDAASQGRA